MSLFGRRGPALPGAVVEALELPRGDRVLAWAQDATTQAYVVATTYALHHVPAALAGDSAANGGPDPARAAAAPSAVGAAAAARWTRPWLDVAAGAWEPKSRTITVTWADGGRPQMWTLADARVDLPSVFQDRVRASVLLAVPVQMGETDLGRVALRKDLATGALVDQVTLRRKSAAADPEVAAYIAELLAHLREQAGL